MTAFTNSPNPACYPARPEGEAPFFSERDLVVAVDQLGVFTLGRFRAAEEVDLLGDDLAAVAVVACGIGPFRVVNAAMDEDLHALFAMLRDRLGEHRKVWSSEYPRAYGNLHCEDN